MLRFVLAAPLALALGAAASPAFADTIELKLQNHAFTPSSFKVKAGVAFSIKVKNLDDTPAEFESHTLKVEKVIAGQSEATVRVKALKPGAYEFFDEFNQAVARGTVIAE
jgi:hypothetical protein